MQISWIVDETLPYLPEWKDRHWIYWDPRSATRLPFVKRYTEFLIVKFLMRLLMLKDFTLVMTSCNANKMCNCMITRDIYELYRHNKMLGLSSWQRKKQHPAIWRCFTSGLHLASARTRPIPEHFKLWQNAYNTIERIVAGIKTTWIGMYSRAGQLLAFTNSMPTLNSMPTSMSLSK